MIELSSDVRIALENKRPVLALESTILAHGMPSPDNVDFALQAESVVRKMDVVPATIAVLDGKIHVGLTPDQLMHLCQGRDIAKAGVRDLATVMARGESAATTVSATLRIAHLAGIPVFSTGGIGGVHRNAEMTLDISQDLWELSRTPGVLVSAGAKAILDLGKTLEIMETLDIPVLGYQTDDFPAFYSRKSGFPVPARIEAPSEIAIIYQHRQSLSLPGALLVVNPVPSEAEIPSEEIYPVIESALEQAQSEGISGKNVTPFLLQKIVDLTAGRSLKTNIALALNNIKLGTEIALELSCLNHH